MKAVRVSHEAATATVLESELGVIYCRPKHADTLVALAKRLQRLQSQLRVRQRNVRAIQAEIKASKRELKALCAEVGKGKA